MQNEDMESPVTASQFLELHKDVKDLQSDLKILVEGKFGSPGLVGRQQRIEDEVETLKTEMEEFRQFKWKIIYWTAGAAFASTAIVNSISLFIT